MTYPIPTVSRTVHYVSHGTPIRTDGTQAYESVCRTAFITVVNEELASGLWNVGLMIANPTGLFFNERVMQMEDGRGAGTWHWPERVPDGPVVPSLAALAAAQAEEERDRWEAAFNGLRDLVVRVRDDMRSSGPIGDQADYWVHRLDGALTIQGPDSL